MNATLKMLVNDIYPALKESYGSGVTLRGLLDEADRQVAGEQPRGSIGIFLNRYLKQVGTLVEVKRWEAH